MNRTKRIGATIAACALTAIVTVGGTMAYLSAVTGTKENKFTSSKGLTGELTETEWEYDERSWDDYIPGDSTGKNPVIVIDDKGVDAYVAMKVECIDGEGEKVSFTDFQNDYATVSYLGNDGTNSKWIQYGDNDFYVYNAVVPANSDTEPLFDRITINTGIVRAYTAGSSQETIYTYQLDEEGNKIESSVVVEAGASIVFPETEKIYVKDEKGILVEVSEKMSLPTFQVNVTGYAIQKSGNESIYTQELAKLAGIQ